MSFAAGVRLGPYEIVGLLGAGGMGEVYRARDTRLDRTVAIKVLSSQLAADPQFRIRFEREARSISQLSHPHICTLHDVGRHEDLDYLVLEFLDGESLATRLERGALPLEDALQIASDIASALDAAHRAGIVHRDLKPGNVVLTRSGAGRLGVPHAKLLDFGLAKSAAPVMTGATMIATAAPVTAQGVILGTFHYMAPEQIEGQEADARSDLWAFGCVLYEMLTGRRPFAASSHAGLITSIMGGEPASISNTVPEAPRDVQRLLAVCLAKSPAERWQSARDLLQELQWIRDRRTDAAPIPPRKARGLPIAVGVALLAALAATGTLAVRHLLEAPAPSASMQFDLSPGGDVAFSAAGSSASSTGGINISPDSRQIVFVGEAGLTRALWLRPIDSLDSKQIRGTDGAAMPFWSPDSRSIGFFAAGRLKIAHLSTDTIDTLTTVRYPMGGTWGADGTILFSPDDQTTLRRIPAAGGKPVDVLPLDRARQESSQRWPVLLPGGRHFLYLSVISTLQNGNGVYLASLDSPERTRLLDVDSQVLYSPDGFLLYANGGALFAQRFDLNRLALAGEPHQIAPTVDQNRVFRAITASVSNTGVLVYRPGVPALQELTWVDRSGRKLGTVGSSDHYAHHALSPDDTRIATIIADPDGGIDIWVIDLQRGTRSRVTRDPAGEGFPVWSPDGRELVFMSNRDGPENMFRKLATGTGQETLLYASESAHKHTQQWSQDGRFIIFDGFSDIWAMPFEQGGKPFTAIATEAAEGQPRVSPDSRWIAYTSNETGRSEVYVQTFPPSGPKWQISADGGGQPRWRTDGSELYYLGLDRRLMSVSIKTTGGFTAGVPQAMFVTPLWQITTATDLWFPDGLYEPTRDGERFLFLVPTEGARSVPAHVMSNWTAALRP